MEVPNVEPLCLDRVRIGVLCDQGIAMPGYIVLYRCFRVLHNDVLEFRAFDGIARVGASGSLQDCSCFKLKEEHLWRFPFLAESPTLKD